MKISEYVEEYTSGHRIRIKHIGAEFVELLGALTRFHMSNIKEESQDVIHFIQLWCFWRFGLDGEIWGASRNSVQKFMRRKAVWQKIYAYVGLPENISNFVGNYKKSEKVVDQLAQFGISDEKARQAYRELDLGSYK